jgi:hypothetical protein
MASKLRMSHLIPEPYEHMYFISLLYLIQLIHVFQILVYMVAIVLHIQQILLGISVIVLEDTLDLIVKVRYICF